MELLPYKIEEGSVPTNEDEIAIKNGYFLKY